MNRIGIGLVYLAAQLAVASDGPDLQAAFPKFEVDNPQIIWAAPTNQSRAALWIYKTLPQTFSGTVVSNLMALGAFTARDAQKWKGKTLPTNTEPLMFVNKSNTCNLLVVPSEGRVQYSDYFAAANHWDKTNHLWELVKGVPNLVEIEKLGLKFLKQFGIQRADLAQKNNGHLITFGTKEKRSYFDRRRKKYIEGEVTTRGVYFNRQVDGISFAGIGIGGGCEIMFGNHAKIADFKLNWRNLQRYEQRKAASPDEIMQRIRDGQAVMTHRNLVNPAEVKKITITEAAPLYMGAAGDKPQDFIYPFAKLEAVVDLGYTNEAVQLYCPILSTKHGDILDVRDFTSPDGRYICTVFGETFHDTTGYARHIYLRRAGEARGYPGNVYVVPVGDDVTVSWTSPTNLSVKLSFETRREVPAVTNVAGVTVSFSEMVK